MTYALPIIVAAFIWWFSTGLVLLLDGMPKRTHVWSLVATTFVTAIAICALYFTAWETTPAAAYIAFTATIVIWGWHELAFLLGIVTGPRRARCPPDAGIGRRFVLAVQVLAYHEIAVALTFGLIVLLLWDAPNQVGTWTFLVLFAMRLSAKLNIFLGVPNMSDEFLPGHMDFLNSYFGAKKLNWLFPFSVTVATLAGAYVFHSAFGSSATPYLVTGYMLTGALILLGTLEHWLLMLPIPDSALWRWALNFRKTPDVANDVGPSALNTGTVNKVKANRLPVMTK